MSCLILTALATCAPALFTDDITGPDSPYLTLASFTVICGLQAGNKVLSLSQGRADVAIINTGTCLWDTCAPEVIVFFSIRDPKQIASQDIASAQCLWTMSVTSHHLSPRPHSGDSQSKRWDINRSLWGTHPPSSSPSFERKQAWCLG